MSGVLNLDFVFKRLFSKIFTSESRFVESSRFGLNFLMITSSLKSGETGNEVLQYFFYFVLFL